LRVPLSIAGLSLISLMTGCAAPPPPSPATRNAATSLLRLGDDMRANGDVSGALGLYRGLP
jgi:hypothetical protein